MLKGKAKFCRHRNGAPDNNSWEESEQWPARLQICVKLKNSVGIIDLFGLNIDNLFLTCLLVSIILLFFICLLFYV
jgi:hypothetical protein